MAVSTSWRPALTRSTVVAGLEVVAVVVVVARDLLIPSVVIVGLGALSLALRRDRPASLGFHRPQHPWRLARSMLGLAALWTLADVALLIPVTNHLSGRRQDVSAFEDLQGDLALLGLFLVASWVLAAFCEEAAFRGYLMTRLTEVLGNGRGAIVAVVVTSSALFGLLHTEQGLVGVVVSGVTGAVFALVRLRLGTVWAPVLMHGFGNTIGFTWFFFFGPFYGLW